MNKNTFNWKLLDNETPNHSTWVAEVPGGWLFKEVVIRTDSVSVALQFVPKPKAEGSEK